MRRRLVVLVELGLVEQRYRAVCEVLDGATVVDVARRNRVARQTVHDWLRAYAADGLVGLVDRSSKPQSCPHQMSPAVEARIVALRRANPGWGPRTILHRLGREGVAPLPGRSSVHRALIRHGLIEPGKRRRRRSDYKRWERGRSMELWQMDVVGGVRLASRFRAPQAGDCPGLRSSSWSELEVQLVKAAEDERGVVFVASCVGWSVVGDGHADVAHAIEEALDGYLRLGAGRGVRRDRCGCHARKPGGGERFPGRRGTRRHSRSAVGRGWRRR